MRLLCARDGNEGITLARAKHPDVILMDINLPGMAPRTLSTSPVKWCDRQPRRSRD
jgi:CheY-like chemotaxis protein